MPINCSAHVLQLLIDLIETLLDTPIDAHIFLLFVVLATGVVGRHDVLHVVGTVADIMGIRHLGVFMNHVEVVGGKLYGASAIATGVLEEHGILKGSISMHITI